jgi:KaiC/GvpD/RAD55 family RecA-like ATPase
MSTVTALRLAILANGYTPLPAAGKAVYLPCWRTIDVTPESIAAWDQRPDWSNTGVRTGAVCAVDIDVLDSALVDAIECEAAMALGATPLRRVGKAPKVTLLYRAADPTAGKAATAEFRLPNGTVARVEALGDGQQTIAFGTHPDTDQPYRWSGATPEDVPLASLPIVTAAEVAALLASAERLIRDAGGVAMVGGSRPGSASPRDAAELAPPDTDSAVALLAAMPNTLPSRADWNAVMLAAAYCAGCVDDGERIRDAALAWSSRWPDNDPAADEAKWEADWSCRDRPLAGWPQLLGWAARLGVDTAPYRTASEFDSVPTPAAVPTVTRTPLRLIHPADCESGPRRGYLIKHLLAPGDVGALIGPPGCGKSMLAPHLAYAVAQGRPAFGLRTKQGRTLYVAAEDFGGMRQRVHALRLQHGDAPDFAMVECGNLRDPASVTALRDTVAVWRPAVVVIDTLGAAWAGMDENSSQDMGNVVEFARRLAATGCAVLLVHHTAKHGDGTPRGHSVLNGTLDMSLRLEPNDDSGVIRGVLGKNRNGTTDRDIAFRYVAVGLGVDSDGDQITAPIAVELAVGEPSAKRQDRLPPTEAAALAVLRDLQASDGDSQPDGRALVAEAAWRQACDDRRVSTADSAKGRADVLRRAYARLRDRGLVQASGGSVWTPVAGQEFAAIVAIASDSSATIAIAERPVQRAIAIAPLGLSLIAAQRGSEIANLVGDRP